MILSHVRGAWNKINGSVKHLWMRPEICDQKCLCLCPRGTATRYACKQTDPRTGQSGTSQGQIKVGPVSCELVAGGLRGAMMSKNRNRRTRRASPHLVSGVARKSGAGGVWKASGKGCVLYGISVCDVWLASTCTVPTVYFVRV